MTSPLVALSLSAHSGSLGVERALDEAHKLLVAAESHAVMLAELGRIELPPAARSEPMQMRAIASLYLAAALEAAGLIEAADDLTRLVRSGAITGDLGDAGDLITTFWNERNSRPNADERLALFARLFGAPSGPVDAMGSVNVEFEEILLDLCDAIMDATDGGSPGRVRAAAIRMAENVANVANDMVLMMAREIIGGLSQAIAILNNEQVRATLTARTLWDAVSAIDRRFRRPTRPTLSHLRRGRAGMAVIAWLADALEQIDAREGAIVARHDPVVDAAIDWVDETLSIIRAEEAPGAPQNAESRSGGAGGSSWLDLAR